MKQTKGENATGRINGEEYRWKKNWLNGYRYTKKEWEYYIGELEDIQEQKLGLSHVLSSMPSSGNGPKRLDDVWAKLIDKTDSIIDALIGLTEDLSMQLQIIHDALNKLPAPERMILTARHIKGLPFREILKEIPYSERTMYTLYGQGIQHLECPGVLQDYDVPCDCSTQDNGIIRDYSITGNNDITQDYDATHDCGTQDTTRYHDAGCYTTL